MGQKQLMVPMRHQPISDESFTEAEAMRLVRSLGRQPHAHRQDRPARRAVLARAVEDEVIPRLLKTAGLKRPAPPAAPAHAVTAEHITDLAQVLIAGTQPQATTFVADMQRAGLSRESVFLHLLTPAAQRLGAMWETDDCDFADVTIGMLRLANVMRVVGDAFETETATVQSGPRALLVQATGEQHGFGIGMLASFFRRAGWNVQSAPLADRAELTSRVQRDWFSLIGLSAACSNRLDSVAADIRAIRAASRNPSIAIMVGGFAFSEHPQLAALVGADDTARDARQAVQRANALVSQRACRR